MTFSIATPTPRSGCLGRMDLAQPSIRPRSLWKRCSRTGRMRATIKATVKSLGQLSGGEAGRHAVEDIDWSGIDLQMAADDNQAVALANYSPDNSDVTEALSSLTDRDFVQPLGEDLTKARFEVTDGAGRPSPRWDRVIPAQSRSPVPNPTRVTGDSVRRDPCEGSHNGRTVAGRT